MIRDVSFAGAYDEIPEYIHACQMTAAVVAVVWPKS